jgi:uncharacterized protein YecT (DUF1311 family)
MKTDLHVSASSLVTRRTVRGYAKLPLLVSVLMCLPAISFAKINCKTAVTTQEINECAQIELQAVEKKLNETYRRVLKSLDRPDEDLESYSQIKKSLVEAQKSWVVFRQKDCDALYTRHASGTIRTVMFIGCMQSHAEKRIKDLSEYEMQ